ncbi:MAG: thioredoxin [Candidatus Bathyarchaeales archaeon]
MSGKREQFISDEDKELEHIRAKKLQKLMKTLKEKEEMPTEPTHLTDSNFDSIINKNALALIDFWAPWCGPCRALAPTIDELCKEYAGKILIGKLNVDENPQTAERFQIFSIPTLVLMKNGKEVDRIVGLVPKSSIEAILNKHLR